MTSPGNKPPGRSDHEMLMEIYHDVKEIREKMSSFVTWKGLGTVAVTIATLSIAFFNLAS